MLVRRHAASALVLALGLAAAVTTNTLCAQDAKNPAAKPLNRDIPRHKQFLKIVDEGRGRRHLYRRFHHPGVGRSGKEGLGRTFRPTQGR